MRRRREKYLTFVGPSKGLEAWLNEKAADNYRLLSITWSHEDLSFVAIVVHEPKAAEGGEK